MENTDCMAISGGGGYQHFGMECVHVIVPPVTPSTLPPPLLSPLLKPSSWLNCLENLGFCDGL